MNEHPFLNLQLRHESGGSLPSVLVAIAVGSILLAPFLAHVSSRMLATRAAQNGSAEQYATDSGIEYATWRLINYPCLQNWVDSNYPNALSIYDSGNFDLSCPTPSITANGMVPSITAAAVHPRGWVNMAHTPDSVNQGGDLSYGGGTSIYALEWQGNNMQLWSYDVPGDNWSTLSTGPAGIKIKAGAGIDYPGGEHIYAILGNKSDQLWTYGRSAGTWQRRDDLPDEAGPGSDLVTAGGYIYALQGGNGQGDDGFWRYSLTDGSWETLASTPADVSDGGSLAYAGGDSIYALGGADTSNFWHYSISSDSWSSLEPPPGDVGDGGALAFTGAATLHALQGNSANLWRYDIATDFWEILDPVPGPVDRGGSLVWDGGDFIYALQGNNTDNFWRHIAAPPKYDLTSTAGNSQTQTRIVLDELSAVIIWWDIQ